MTSPPAAPALRSGWTLSDVIGVETLQAIQDAFAEAFGLPTVITDTGGGNVTEITHRVAFCEDLTRPSPGGTRCTACDADAMRRAAATGQPAIFRCWNRLYDCAIPIASSEGRLFGYFLCGQIFTEPEPVEQYAVIARELGVDAGAYVTAAQEVRVVPQAIFERSVDAMGVLARMIADQASASIQNLAVLEQALEARSATERLTRELDTIVDASGAIAAAGDSRTALERIADAIRRVIPCDSCIMFEVEARSGRLRPLTVRDPYADAIADWRPEVGVGIPGLVAQSGAALRIDDVPADPRFVPVPGVPVEPEAILAVPMLFDGDVTGVITVSRFKQRTFSDHELDVLKILAAQSAIAVATAGFRESFAQRLEVERGLAELASRVGAGGPLRPLLNEVVAVAHRLLACSAAVLRVEGEPGSRTRVIGMSERSGQALARALADVRERASAARRPVECEHDGQSMLVAPVEAAGRAVGELFILGAEPFSDSDRRLAAALADQAGAAIGNARVERTTSWLRAGYTLLSEIGAEIARSHSIKSALDVVVRRGYQLVGGNAAIVALISGASEIDAHYRSGADTRHTRLATAGHPRLRLAKTGLSEDGGRELLDAWGHALIESLADAAGSHSVTAPLLAAGGELMGALVVLGERQFGEEERGLLSVLAHIASAGLVAKRAEHETDSLLRARVERFGRLNELGQQITAARDRHGVALALLNAVRELCSVKAAAFVVSGASERPAQVFATVGLSRARAARLVVTLPEDSWNAVEPSLIEDILIVPVACEGRLTGLIVGTRPHDDFDEVVVMSLARYGAIAWDGAERLEAEQDALSALEEAHQGSVAQTGELERSLAIQRALSSAVLGQRGIASVAETLVRLQGGRVTIYDADLEAIAGCPEPPAENEPIARILEGHGDFSSPSPLEIELAEGQVLIAAPIQAEGERLGWLVQLLSRAFGEVDRAAVAHAATAVALAMLRARTAEEVEARMRGEFLQALLAGEATPEELVRRGRALTYDFTQSSRVVVVASPEESAEAAERLYRETLHWARRDGRRIFVAKRGNELTVLCPSEEDPALGLHDALVAAVGPVLVGVGPAAKTPSDYPRSFLDARQCVRSLRSLGRDGVLSVEADGLEQLLLRAADTDRLVSFAARFVDPLRDHDAHRRSALVSTLELVFAHGWNLHAAARAAHVHVSTLRYRLARVEQIVGVDLRRPDDRLTLELALRISRLLAAPEGGMPAPRNVPPIVGAE